MTIKIIYGDIFDPKLPEDRVIVHGCNAQGVMGSGIALEIKNRYQEAYLTYERHYRQCYSSRTPMLGTVTWATIGKTTICNAVTQQYYGRDKDQVYVSYDAVFNTLKAVARGVEGMQVHLPFIGGGLANGNRPILLEVFKQAFKDTDATLFIKE